MNESSNDDYSNLLPPPPKVMDDTAQILQNVLGDEDEDEDEEELIKDEEKTENDSKGNTAAMTTNVVETSELVSEEEEEESEYSDSEEEEEVVLDTMEDKHSLIALAAEHDRVDILQAILEQEVDETLHRELLSPSSSSGVEAPLCIACRYQSVHAVACLLRLGAAVVPSLVNNLSSFSHAIEAETLRAIGADEWTRIQEFIQAGLNPQTFTIAQRSLLDWSHDMNAATCIHELTSLSPPPKTTTATTTATITKPTTSSTAAVASIEIDRDNNKDGDGINADMKTEEEDHEESNGEVELDDAAVEQDETGSSSAKKRVVVRSEWEEKLEESEALASALSQLLDSLAEELSVTQGLLYNKNALLSHIAAIKTTRANKEDELQEWQQTLKDYQMELQMITKDWYYATQPEADDDEEYEDDDDDYEYEPILPLPQPPTTTTNNTNDHVDPKQLFSGDGDESDTSKTEEQWKELWECSQLRITKLRSSITDLANEKTEDMKEIERLGLTGAVNLAQSLREEVQQIHQQLDNTRNEAASTRLQIDTIREALNHLLYPSPDDSNITTTPRSHPTPYLELEQSPNHPLPPSSSTQPSNDNGDSNENEDRSTSLDSDSSTTVAVQSSSSSSKAVVPYVIRKGYLPLHFWDLILRIFGLGKRSVKKAVRDQLTTKPQK